jgi:DNA-binding CsgD family transcriptional regulator
MIPRKSQRGTMSHNKPGDRLKERLEQRLEERLEEKRQDKSQNKPQDKTEAKAKVGRGATASNSAADLNSATASNNATNSNDTNSQGAIAQAAKDIFGDLRDSFKSSFSYATGFCGYGFFLAVWKWYDIVLYGSFLSSYQQELFQILFACGLIISVVACKCALRKRPSLLANKAYLWAVTGSLCAVSLVCAIIHLDAWPYFSTSALNLNVLMGALQGYAIGASVLLWAERFGLCKTSRIIAGMSVAYTLCLLLFFYLLNLTSLFAGVTVLALPLLAHAFLVSKRLRGQPGKIGFRVAQNSNEGTTGTTETAIATTGTNEATTETTTGTNEATTGTTPFSPMKASKSVGMLLWVVLATFVFKITQSYSIANSAALEFFQIGSLVPIVIIVAYLGFFPRRVYFQSMYRISLVLLTLGLLVFFFASQANVLGQIMVGSGYFVVSITMMIVVASYASLSKTSAAHGYAFVIIANSLGALLSLATPHLLALFNISLADNNAVFLVLVVALILLVPYALRRESSLYMHFNTVDSALAAGNLEVNESWLCESFGNVHQLTKREIGILFLHVRGYSPTDIAQELFIAEGTVRAHYNNIYRKIPVHSKEELNEALEEYRKQL